MIEVTAAVITEKGRVLICQRPIGKNCALLWEFPGGKTEPFESAEECVVRECMEELNLALSVQGKITEVVYSYPDRTVHLQFFACRIESGAPVNKEHNAIAWVAPQELHSYNFCPADNGAMKAIIASCSGN